jgi:hypothetical protein
VSVVILSGRSNATFGGSSRAINAFSVTLHLSLDLTSILDGTSANFAPSKRPLPLAALHITYAIAGSIGPLLGGGLATTNWRLIFYLNLPFAGLSFILLLLFLDVHNPRTPLIPGLKAIDWSGALIMVGMMVMVLLGLNMGGTGRDWGWGSARTVSLVVVGSVLIGVFVVNERKLVKYPIMPMEVFGKGSNVGCLIVCFVQHFVSWSFRFVGCVCMRSLARRRRNEERGLEGGQGTIRSGSERLGPMLFCAVPFMAYDEERECNMNDYVELPTHETPQRL